MTKALEEAIKVVTRLPDRDRDALAAAILQEVAFDAAIEGNPRALEKLADEALEDERAGRADPLDPDRL